MSLHHWENYYRAGALASCPLGSDGGYTQELRDVWVEFFSGLRDGARIVDVGTGNGAIALFARQVATASGKNFEIHGTDLAHIDPVRDVRDGPRLFAGIRFHALVATEQLPFATGSIDAVTGQYSLEYTDVRRALREIRRVLKPGSHAQFVLHHAASIVAHKARESLQQSRLILEETLVFRKLRRHLKTGQHSPRASRRILSDLVAAVDILRQAALQAEDGLILHVTIDAVNKLLAARPQAGTAALVLEAERIEASVRASVHRLKDLVHSCQTEADMQGVATLARDLGFEIAELTPQHHAGNNLVGWRLRLTGP